MKNSEEAEITIADPHQLQSPHVDFNESLLYL